LAGEPSRRKIFPGKSGDMEDHSLISTTNICGFFLVLGWGFASEASSGEHSAGHPNAFPDKVVRR
jgi:hypothetical protein